MIWMTYIADAYGTAMFLDMRNKNSCNTAAKAARCATGPSRHEARRAQPLVAMSLSCGRKTLRRARHALLSVIDGRGGLGEDPDPHKA